MNENFSFYRLSKKHKKLYTIHKLMIMFSLIFMTAIAIRITNPVLVETNDKMNVTMGVSLGIFVFVLAFMNRLKSLLKIKFAFFLITWALLLSLSSVLWTLIWAFGLNIIPLAIDDLILVPYWKNVWYNNYEQ